MKYFLIVLVALFAVAAAAPQWVSTYPGVVGVVPTALGARTVVAGPTVVNHAGWGWPGTWGWNGVVPTVV